MTIELEPDQEAKLLNAARGFDEGLRDDFFKYVGALLRPIVNITDANVRHAIKVARERLE